MAIKQYQAFREPSPYDRERQKAEQLRRYAELLQQQALAPEDEPYTFQGIRAMPSPAAALGKLLQAYGAKKAGEKADEAEARKMGMEQEAASQIAGRLMGSRPITDANTMPDDTGLAEVAVQSEYRASPEDAMRKAMTPQGMGAVKGNPMLAAALQKSMETPAAEEFYAPTETEGGLVQFGKRGGKRETGYKPPTKAPESTTTQRDYEFARSQGYQGSFEDFRQAGTPKTTVDVRYGAPVAGVDAQGNPVFFQPNPTGGPPSIISGVAPKPEAMGAGEANAALFADRAARAEPVFNQLPPPSLSATAKGGLGPVGNVLLTPENRQFFQAERNFITAVLRKESGANIPENEYNDARRVYIPQVGDDERTLEMKRQARQDAIAGIARGAGPAYKPPGMDSSKGNVSNAPAGALSPAEQKRLDELRRKKSGRG